MCDYGYSYYYYCLRNTAHALSQRLLHPSFNSRLLLPELCLSPKTEQPADWTGWLAGWLSSSYYHTTTHTYTHRVHDSGSTCWVIETGFWMLSASCRRPSSASAFPPLNTPKPKSYYYYFWPETYRMFCHRHGCLRLK